MKRQWRKLNTDQLKTQMSQVDWNPLYSCTDPNLAYDILETKLREALDSQIPVKQIQTRKDHRSWMSRRTNETMEARDNARVKATTTDNSNNWKEFRTQRNKVTEMVRKDIKNFIHSLYSNTDNDPKTLYRKTKKQLGLNTSGPPVSLIINGSTVSSPVSMANEQFSYFVNKIEKLNAQLPDSH